MDKIFFLDRNALSDIKRSVSGGTVPIDRLRKLRAIDKPGNTISLMLAFREGQNKKIESSNEIEESILKDAQYIDKFYKKAKTDSNYFLKNINLTSETLSGMKGKEYGWDNYIEFLKYVHQKLYQPIARNKRYEMAKTICEKANELKISPGHPTIVCAISSLYGNLSSQKVLKAKPSLTGVEADKHAYNVLNDLIIISRLTSLKMHVGQNSILKLITFDKPLEQLFKLIRVDKIKRTDYVDRTSVETTVTYSFELFSEADEEEQSKVIELLKSGL